MLRLPDTGWKFPIQVDKATGRIMMSSGADDIHEAVKLIVMTAKKERKMRPGFGSNINRYAFGLGDRSTLVLLEEDIRKAIENWEPRVSDIEVKAAHDMENQERIIIDVSYRVESTGNEYNRTLVLDA